MHGLESRPGSPGRSLLSVGTASFLALLFFGAAPAASFAAPWSPGVQDDEKSEKKKKKDDEKSEKDGDRTKVGEKEDTDLEFVKSRLEGFLSATKVEWLEDGRVEIELDFGEKDEGQSSAFSPTPGGSNKDPFRWTYEDEEFVQGGMPGLRVSDAGYTLLRCWFEDDVEASMEFRQYVNQTGRHVMGLAFVNEKHQGIGTNYGSRMAMFSKGRLAKQGKNKIRGVRFDSTAVFKIAVKDGEFRTFRESSEGEKAKYATSRFETGRIGFIWGGGQSGIIGKVTLRGKIAAKDMAEEIRGEKTSPRRR